MGTKADFRRRQKVREDTPSWRDNIKLVRSWIFDKGYRIAGAAIDRMLKPQSWVPTIVSFMLALIATLTHCFVNPECVLKIGSPRI
jgi:hypothetical protein